MSKPTKIPPSTPSEILRQRLVQLDATKDGFEGLIAALVSAATAGQMRLMSSGDQKGVDALSDPSNTSARRAMQAKRYEKGTGFNLNTLLGEMVRAESAYPDIDTWVMASTKALNGKEAQELTEHAHGLGWSFIALDWGAASGLPRLAALCAAYPDITIKALPGADIQRALNAIKADSFFEVVSTAVLADLRSEEVGLRAAAKHTHIVLDQIYRDPVLARRLAGPSPVLLAEAPPVARPGLSQGLQNWWSGDKRIVGLIGDEGTGKTWQGLQFMRGLASVSTPPVVVVIKSKRAEEAKNGYDAVIETLADMFASSYTKVADPKLFWQRRVRRWAKSDDKSVKVLVLVDGLDELDPFDWVEWLAPLLSSDVASLFRIVLACRSYDWSNRLAIAQSYSDMLNTIAVPKFEKEERDAYLVARGIDIALVSDKVLDAALHPRTAYHLTRMAKNLPDLSRITREQLLLRDFQNRWHVKGGIMTGEDFRTLVQNMAKQAQDAALHQKAFSMTKGAVLEEVQDITGYDKSKMRTVLSDLLSSAWCQTSGANPTKLEFRDEHLPDAVGMALASEIIGKDVGEAEKHLERFLEPWGADDILEPILRTCATTLMIEPTVGDGLCAMILKRWFKVPFHNDAGQDFWRRVHIFRPTLMLDFAEENGRNHRNWLVEWGIANLWEDHPEARQIVEDRLRQWLIQSLLPKHRKQDNADFERYMNRERRWQLGRAAVLQRNGLTQWHQALTTEPKSDESYLPTLAVRTMSFLPRLPMLPLIREWALTTAAAGHSDIRDNMAALVRYNKIDYGAVLIPLRACANELRAKVGLGVGRRAAAALLHLTGLEEDAVAADALSRPDRPQSGTMLKISDGEIGVTPDGLANCKNLMAALEPFAGDPHMRLSPALRAALQPMVTDLVMRPDVLRNSASHRRAVVRWFKDDLRAAVAAQLLAPLPTAVTEADARGNLRELGLLAVPGLDEAERGAVGENFAKGVEPDGTGWPIAIAYQLSALPAPDQIALVVRTPREHLPKDFGYLLRPPTRDDVEALAHSIDFTASSDDTQLRLQLLCGLIERHNIEGLGAKLDWITAFQHIDRTIATNAMEVALALDKAGAAVALKEADWTYKSAIAPQERFMGSNLLAALPDSEFPTVLARLQPEALVYLYYDRANLRPVLTAPILDWLKDEFLTRRTSHSIGGQYMVYSRRNDFYASFYADQGDAVDAVLQHVFADRATRRNITFSDVTSPGWPLLRAAGNRHPDLAAQWWVSALEDNRGSYIGNAETYPARLVPNPTTEGMRREMLRRADTDDCMFRAAVALQSGGHQATLIAEAQHCWHSTLAVEKARALVIAAFLCESAEANALWDTLQRPVAGWLSGIYDKTQRIFREGSQARHWARVVSQSSDVAEIWTAYLLLLDTVDDRLFIDPPAFDVPTKSWKAHWLDYLLEQRTAARSENQKSWKDGQLLSPKVSDMVYLD